jgi:hypothetical protein
MINRGASCDHIAVKLPDGNYFDGGNGVISGKTLLRQFPPGAKIEVMDQFDLRRLDKWAYRLNRSFPDCPTYSDQETGRLVACYLAMLPAELIPSTGKLRD